MLYLLSQLNSAMQQLHISGYAGDLKSLGSLRIQSECDIYAFKKRNRRISKAQRRHLFLFDGGLLFCKKRTQPVAYAPEYYEHKINIPTSSLGFTEISTTSPSRFDVWDEKKNEAYAVKPMDDDGKSKWLESLQRLSIQGDRLTAERAQHRVQRPQSWTSTISNESSTSRQSSSGDTVNSVDCNFVDTNGNQSVLSLTSPTSNTTSCKVLSPSNGDKCITKTTNIIYSSPKSSIDSGVTRFILETFDIPKEQTTAANVVDYSSANHDFVSTVETFDC
ncbi:hypothetical protein AB6A40_007944 [Gnathostoma spinigerum]|uniref:PH domain-containing protein n=1 Tax=Gnathostoma spinigerum TaxID=75299 RepID=A0ABD6ENY4_9BILA